MRLGLALGLLASVPFLACVPRGPELLGSADPRVCDEAFDDHTHPGAIDTTTFEAFRQGGAEDNPQSVDFIVVHVTDATLRHVRFEDGRFYEFHDQWSWFRLMNGVTACGSSADPVMGEHYESITAIKEALLTRAPLPLDLVRASGDRLVSPSFYALALRTTPRVYAPGTLFRRVTPGADDRWFFELEFVDTITEADLLLVHRALEATLPGASPQLFWRAVSADQSALGDVLERGIGPLHDRVLRLGEEP